ncbi:hypothetical protein GCK32_012897 [Trichostrongylus colubriformis]|uniref:Uncharacterized protein n=1 Tax=Trichostrongylus colubriformis TaxID=6319 RepID=A0AAN8FX56_TRICO
METLEKKKIFFEEADRPPPSYYDGSLEKMPLRKVPFQTPDPEVWLKAPEFVPRTKMLTEAFAPPLDCPQDHSSLTEVPYVPIGHLPPNTVNHCVAPPFAMAPAPAPPYVAAPPFPPMVPMPPAATGPIAPRMPVIPNGYTVNITNLNQGAGPPIPAIVLRKKRRKRNKNTQSLVMNSSYAAAVDSEKQKEKLSPPPSSPKQDVNEASDSEKAIKGCFPVYDVLPRSLRDVAEQQLDGFSNPEIRRLDREINGITFVFFSE